MNATAATEIYPCAHTLSLHDAVPIWLQLGELLRRRDEIGGRHIPRRHPRLQGGVALDDRVDPLFGDGGHISPLPFRGGVGGRSEEHTSELQSLMRISYAVFCLKKKTYVKTTI